MRRDDKEREPFFPSGIHLPLGRDSIYGNPPGIVVSERRDPRRSTAVRYYAAFQEQKTTANSSFLGNEAGRLKVALSRRNEGVRRRRPDRTGQSRSRWQPRVEVGLNKRGAALLLRQINELTDAGDLESKHLRRRDTTGGR